MTITPQAVHEPTLKERIGAFNLEGGASWLNMILYGEPSVGKTHAFGTVELDPENFLPALLIDIDGGTDTLRNRKQIDISPPIRKLSTLQEVYKEVAAQPDYYKTIGIDNITELQKIDMAEVMQEAKDRANNPDNVDIYVPSQREWGKSSERMRRIIRAFRDLPCHTIVLAHVDAREEGVITKYGPSLPGKLRHELSGFFSVVGYMDVYEKEGKTLRKIQFTKTRRVQARDRFNALPELMDDIGYDTPTIPNVWRIIKESGPQIDNSSPLLDDPLSTLKGAITHESA